MAKINELTIKSLKVCNGVEGKYYQGNIYLGNKKLGFWSQDSWGGPDYISLLPQYSLEKLEERVKELHVKDSVTMKDFTIEYGLELLFNDIAFLKEKEKTFKDAKKKGYDGALFLSDRGSMMAYYVMDYIKYSPEKIDDIIKSSIYDPTRVKLEFFYNETEFNKGEPILLEEILKEVR